jgi:hypothetical protein
MIAASVGLRCANPTYKKRMSGRVSFIPFSIHVAAGMYKKSHFLTMLQPSFKTEECCP